MFDLDGLTIVATVLFLLSLGRIVHVFPDAGSGEAIVLALLNGDVVFGLFRARRPE